MNKNIKRLSILILLSLLAGACAMPQLVIPETGGQPRALPTESQSALTSTSLQSTISALQTVVAAASATAAAPAAGAAPILTLPATVTPVSSVPPQPSSTALATATPYSLPTTAPITATPTATATSSLPCNKADFVADMTAPDDTHFDNGVVFIKAWRLRNSGACAWTTGYSLVFDHGYNMGTTQKVNLNSPVLPGQTTDVSVTLTTPSGSGSFQGNWMLQDESGKRFGIGANGLTSFWVRISTGIIATNTPSVSGNCQLGAVSPDINATFSAGNELDMRWTVTNISGFTWNKDNVDYVYVSGTKMYKHDSTYNLTTDVPSGNSVNIIVDTIAPSSKGFYSTTWALMNGSTTLCYLSNTIYVK
jgi:hypothetical protein